MKRLLFWRWLPIRWRLTLFYTSLVAVLLTLFAVYLYTTLTQTQASDVDRLLHDSAQGLINNSSVWLPSGWSDTDNGPLVAIPVDSVSDADTFAQVVDFNGHIHSRSNNLGSLNLPVPKNLQQLAAAGKERYETIQVGNTPLRIYSRSVSIAGQPAFVIQVARIITDLSRTANNLGRLLIAGIAVAIVVSLLAGYFLSGSSLRPVERVTRAAHEIGDSRDFNRRVPYSGPDDEIGRLASTFNTMLQELEEAYADLSNALSAQRRFVADASHELRTPLTAIRGNAELMQRIPNMDPADVRESVDEMVREAQRMSRLVNNLLALARADAGMQLQKTAVSVAALVEEVASQARYLSSSVPFYVGPVPAVELYGDRDYVKQLLLVLVDNALKYTNPPGWVAISASLVPNGVTIAVEDTGIGIAANHLPHIFERFYRADSARSSQGTGLGLSIGQWIAEQHGTNIQVSSEPGRGSIFSVTFPLAPSPNGSAIAPPVEQPAISGMVVPFGN